MMEFDQISLYMPLYWEALGWDYYKSIFAVSGQYLQGYSQDGF